ncbi:MAG: FG-GAP repeat protein, partial [Vicinamibacterales bacterium]
MPFPGPITRLLAIAVGAIAFPLAAGAVPTLSPRQVLQAPSPTPADGFGRAVGIAADHVVVGANGDDRRGLDAGAVYVFQRHFDSWSYRQELLPAIRARDFYGWAVAADAGTVVVGAPGDDERGIDAGAAYVFALSNGTWQATAKLTSSDAATGDQCGASLAVSADTILLGCYNRDEGTIDTGAVYVFRRQGADWAQEAKLTVLRQGTVRFGSALAIDGDRAVIGSPDTFNYNFGFFGPRGAGFLFERSGSTWSWTNEFYPFQPTISGGGSGDRFGASVAITDSLALLGGPLNNGYPLNPITPGAALFQEADDDNRATLIPSTAAQNGQYGGAVAMSASFLAIGSANPAGSLPVVVYRNPGVVQNASPATEYAVLHWSGANGARFGSSLAVNGHIVAAGAPGDDAGTMPGAVAIFDLAYADDDASGLPDSWEATFNVGPGIAGGSPSDDPDGDGLTNQQEFGQGTHPRGVPSYTRYFAEGVTGFFETRLSLANPGLSPATVLLRFLGASGVFATHVVVVPAQQSRKVAVSTLPGMSATEFSTVVESDHLVVADRQQWWDATAYGTSAERSVDAPALTWYFAEGATHGGFDLFYLLQNPNDTAADVLVRYLLPSGAPLEKTYSLPAQSRFNIWADLEVFPAGSGNLALAATDVSAVITVTNGVPIIAERAMYLNAGSTVFAAGHESAGVTAPANHWFFAEGATGVFFDTFVLLANPSVIADAQVRATYLLPDGSTLTKQYSVPANARINIWLDQENFPDGQGGVTQALADSAVSVVLDVLNDVPVVAERSMWWPGPTASTWSEAHNAFGSQTAGTTWGFAEGIVLGAPTNTDTFLLVANTGTATARIRVTLLFDNGTAAVAKEYDVAAQSRFKVAVRQDFPEAVNKGFGAIVESLGASPQPSAVERAMYSDASGQFLAGGSVALG